MGIARAITFGTVPGRAAQEDPLCTKTSEDITIHAPPEITQQLEKIAISRLGIYKYNAQSIRGINCRDWVDLVLDQSIVALEDGSIK